MRILITGICGFVGSTLARGLREGWPDWEIVGLDNLVRAGSETNRLTLRELGRRLGFGVTTLRRWQVPGVDLGSRQRYRLAPQ